MENQFSQEKLDALIDRHLNTGESKFRRAFTEGKRFAKYTELNSAITIKRNSASVVFKRSIQTKLIYTVFGVSLLFISSIVVYFSAPFFILGIGLFGCSILIGSAWNDENNILEINTHGLIYNDVTYPWRSIEKTVILSEVFGGTRNTTTIAYLVLGLKTGRNKLLEITELDLKGSLPFYNRTIVLSHYVEYFKQKSEIEI